MENIFNNQLIQGIIIGLVVAIIPSIINYYNNKKIEKVKHEYLKKINNMQPFTASEILKKENYLNSKRDIIYQSVNLMSREFASKKWIGKQVPKNRKIDEKRPTESEINDCFGKLCIFVDDEKVLKQYFKIFGTQSSAADWGIYLDLVRKDLDYGNVSISPELFPYFFNTINSY
ncbi:hypothetical protein JBL43_14480 [Aureibaculum sp. A20]|uniref:Uncharacterized protein n=1 Tax=Aureibaculum flavum TaxID=2795986 RepID=A0ABS0WTZ4_9FLAO|nr:hypothetical protein [Aureibaculum flavum]MBJ2175455.1 hypothetical protein [Aureibaculum flavum]